MKKITPWTLDKLKEHYAKLGKEVPESTLALLARPGYEHRIRVEPLPTQVAKVVPETSRGRKKVASETLETVKKKRQGVKVDPILNSIRSADIEVAGDETFVSFKFEGARLLTVNEIFAILQYRKFQTFGYKKLWHQLMTRAVQQLQEKPVFTEKTKLVLYRRGKKLVDLDAVPVMFKYAIDALRKEGLIEDDNPNVITEVEVVQEKGEPCVGLRLEKQEQDPRKTPSEWMKVWGLPPEKKTNSK